MTNELIDGCYQNLYGLNLRKYHRKICRIQEDEAFFIGELNRNNRIIFQDGISTSFELQIHDRLVYLMGDKTCYLCSNVVRSAYGQDLNWVSCIVMPGSIRISGETNIALSGVIVSLFSDIIYEIRTERHFSAFIENLDITFSSNKWFKRIFSLSTYIKLAKFWDYREKIERLYSLGLLYPLEFAIYTIYRGADIKNERILKYFIASLSESTNKILTFEELASTFNNLTRSEIEATLGVEVVARQLRDDIINDEYFADILEIDGNSRYPAFVNGTYFLYHMRARADSVFKTPKFRKEYMKIIKQNFRSLENKIRKGLGYESVGSFYMETFLFKKLQTEFPNLKFQSQYSPNWLRPQRLDIYVEECNLGIEYHGAQHYLPIDFFGGKAGLELRKQLDVKKREKCLENGVTFFEISYEEDFDFSFKTLKSKIEELLSIRQP